MRPAVGLFSLAAAAFAFLLKAVPVTAQDDPTVVWILMVKDYGVDSPTLVQPYLDCLWRFRCSLWRTSPDI